MLLVIIWQHRTTLVLLYPVSVHKHGQTAALRELKISLKQHDLPGTRGLSPSQKVKRISLPVTLRDFYFLSSRCKNVWLVIKGLMVITFGQWDHGCDSLEETCSAVDFMFLLLRLVTALLFYQSLTTNTGVPNNCIIQKLPKQCLKADGHFSVRHINALQKYAHTHTHRWNVLLQATNPDLHSILGCRSYCY